jgi:hypothetical protein
MLGTLESPYTQLLQTDHTLDMHLIYTLYSFQTHPGVMESSAPLEWKGLIPINSTKSAILHAEVWVLLSVYALAAEVNNVILVQHVLLVIDLMGDGSWLQNSDTTI